MVSQEEKLERFAKAVNDEIDGKIKDINASAKASRDEIIEKANDESLFEAYDKIKDEIKNISKKYTKLVSKAELDSKREILLYRSGILSKIIANVTDKLLTFTKSDDYAEYICKALSKQIPADTDLKDVVVYVSNADMILQKQIKSKLGDEIEIQPKDSIKIGGVCVYFKSQNILKDATLDTALEEEKLKFNQSEFLRLS